MLGVALLGVVGVLAGLALASTGPSTPRITSGPARQTRTRTATFSFKSRQPGVTFECSLDGSGYAACRSPRRYGVQAPGGHVFRVRARSASGVVGSPASYAWTIDLKAPKLAVSFVASDGVYGSVRWNAGCVPYGTGVCGTVAAPAGVKSVIVWIKQNASGRWWNGRAFTARQTVWLTAALIPKPAKGRRVLSGTWIYRLALPQQSGSYTILARGSDQIGNLNRLKTQKRVSFTINTDPPPAPQISSGPGNPSAATSATFTFIGGSSAVAYQCNLDNGGWRPCSSPISYTGLSTGDHGFRVRAVDQAGNQSGATTYPWTITDPGGTPFTISGDAAGALYPGGGEQIPLTFHNPNPATIYVTGVTVALQTSSLPTGCSSSSYIVTQAAIPAGGVAVPADGTLSLPAQGASAPSIQMIDTGTNQDACQNANLQLGYSGSAHS